MERNRLSNIIIKFSLLNYLFFQFFALLHISGHRLNLDSDLTYTHKETTTLFHDPDSGCILEKFLNQKLENSPFSISFNPIIIPDIINTLPSVEDYISVHENIHANKAPPSFS